MKLINLPKGAAGEYSKFAMSFYEGCTEKKCEYCYMCAMSKRFGSYFGVARLKEWLIDEDNALEVFKKEVKKIKTQLQKHGLFFNFSSDPFLPQSLKLNFEAFSHLFFQYIPIVTLTKQAGWVDEFLSSGYWEGAKDIAFGFTLTGHDELEPGASTNAERIEAMKKLHDAGYKTFASIEPIIDFESSYKMIEQTLGFCDLYKVGLLSGARHIKSAALGFVLQTMAEVRCNNSRVYFKDSIVSAAGAKREEMNLWRWGSCLVDRDYNIFQ